MERELSIKRKKNYWCWHCLKQIRWQPNPHHIKSIRDLHSRPQLERDIIMPAKGLPSTISKIDPRLRLRNIGVHALNPDAHYPSMMNLLDNNVVMWKEVEGEYAPYCPSCDLPLINQDKWTHIKKWIKYPLIVLMILSILRFAGWLLGRDFLLLDI
jgi:hypothetical protein